MSFNKDKTVYRILSGQTNIYVANKSFIIKGVTVAQKYIVEQTYEQLLDRYSEDLMSDDELYDWLIDNNLWSIEEDDKIEKYRKDIEDFQVKLFELGFKGKEKELLKKYIKVARANLTQLVQKRHSFDQLSARGMATIEKNKFLIGLGLCDRNGKNLFTARNFWRKSLPLFNKIIIAYNDEQVKPEQYREIARTDPWRQYWSAKEGTSSVFSVAATELTEEQLALISWTRLYDSIFQHPKCPEDTIIEDDDALDGFLILDKRERDKSRGLAAAEELIKNPLIKNADEIYIIAQTKEDIEKVNNLNSDKAKHIKRRRDKYIEEKGKVMEHALPDVSERLRIEASKSGMDAAMKRK